MVLIASFDASRDTQERKKQKNQDRDAESAAESKLLKGKWHDFSEGIQATQRNAEDVAN